MKERIYKLDFIKTKNFCSEKDTIQRIRRQATDWEKISANDASDKELVSKIYEELLKLNNKKMNNPILKISQRLKQTPHHRRYTDGK